MGAVMERKETALAEPQESGQYLTFMLGSDMFAIAISHIKEIIEYSSLTTVPMMPDFIRGVINVRGSVLPVIDLRLRFGRESGEVTKRTCIVILEVATDGDVQDVGVVVDLVNEVLEIGAEGLSAAPSFGANIRADFISGMARINGRLVVVLDIGKVLSIEEIAMLAEASAHG